jgi:hypothetical protein
LVLLHPGTILCPSASFIFLYSQITLAYYFHRNVNFFHLNTVFRFYKHLYSKLSIMKRTALMGINRWLSFNLGSGWTWVVILMPRPLCHRLKVPRYPMEGKMQGLRACMDFVRGKNNLRSYPVESLSL